MTYNSHQLTLAGFLRCFLIMMIVQSTDAMMVGNQALVQRAPTSGGRNPRVNRGNGYVSNPRGIRSKNSPVYPAANGVRTNALPNFFGPPMSALPELAPITARFAALPARKRRKFERIVVFGDSLSCVGQYYERVRQILERIRSASDSDDPLPEFENERPGVYNENRFVDHLVWHEYLHAMTKNVLFGLSFLPGIPIENFACAWANAIEPSTRIEGGVEVIVPNLAMEIDQFLLHDEKVSISGSTLYIIWIGANDYTTKNRRPESVIATTIEAMIRILNRDPNATFLIPGILPGEYSPLIRNPRTRKLVEGKMDKHNNILKEALEKFMEKYNLPHDRVMYADVTRVIRNIIDNRVNLGFDESLEPCVKEGKEVCKYPGKKVYLDDVHLTSRLHRFIAKFFWDVIRGLIDDE